MLVYIQVPGQGRDTVGKDMDSSLIHHTAQPSISGKTPNLLSNLECSIT